MKRIIFLGALISIIVLSVGCNTLEEDADLKEPTEFDYEIIDEGDLNEATKKWCDKNKENYGFYSHGVNELSHMIIFNINLNVPSPDDLVTEFC